MRMDSTGDAVLHLGVELGQDIPIIHTSLLDITDCSLLNNVADQESLYSFILGHTSPTVGAPDGVDVAAAMLVAPPTPPLHRHGCE